MNDNNPVYVYDLNLELSKLKEEIEQKIKLNNKNEERMDEIENDIRILYDQMFKMYNGVYGFISDVLIQYAENNNFERNIIDESIHLHHEYYSEYFNPNFDDIDALGGYINRILLPCFTDHGYTLSFNEAGNAMNQYCQKIHISPFRLIIGESAAMYEYAERIYEQWINDHADKETEQT